MSSLINKIKDAVSGDKESQARAGHYDDLDTGNTAGHHDTAGPHSSSITNKADPRIDSDRDHRSNPTSTMGQGEGYGTNNPDYDNSRSMGQNESYGTNDPSYDNSRSGTTTGPHSSSMMNKADPRVDSDNSDPYHPHKHHSLKERRDEDYANTQTGLGPTGQELGHDESTAEPTPGHSNLPGNAGAGGADYDNSIGRQYNDQPIAGRSADVGSTEGSMLNRVNPMSRYDEDRSGYQGTGTPGLAGGNTQSYGGGQDTGTTGLAGRDTQGYSGGQDSAGYSLGSENTTGAGPHKSDFMNKMDPRVDSDRDGSKMH